MATYNKFNSFVEAVMEKVHNLGADSMKVMLTNVVPLATNSIKTDITEIAPGNGYTAGGTATTITSSLQTAGTYKLTITDVTFTAAVGSMAAFRYAVLYNDTALNKELIGFFDYGAALTLLVGESLLVDFDAAAGVITLV